MFRESVINNMIILSRNIIKGLNLLQINKKIQRNSNIKHQHLNQKGEMLGLLSLVKIQIGELASKLRKV